MKITTVIIYLLFKLYLLITTEFKICILIFSVSYKLSMRYQYKLVLIRLFEY